MSAIYDFSLSLYENGQWDEACDLLEEQIPSLDAGDVRDQLVLLLGVLYLQKKQTDALNMLVNRYKILGDRKELVYLIMGDAVRANTGLNFINDGKTLYALGLYHEGRNNIPEALKAYKKSLEADSTFLPTYNNLALLYEKTGQVLEARTLYERGLAMDKDNPYLQINLAIFLSRMGSFRKKWTISDSLTALPPSLLATLISFLFVRDNRPTLAIKVLDRQLSKTEKIPSIWYARGLVLESQGLFSQAFSSYQKAWQLDFSNKTILRALLQLLFKNGRTSEMIEILSLIREEAPYREDVRFFSAVVEMQSKEWEKAELNLRYILNHTQVKNLYQLGKNIPHMGALDPIINLDLSESFYEQSLYLLAVLYDHTKKYEQSLLLLTRLKEEVPANDLYIFSTILLLTKMGRNGEALEKVDKALSNQPSHLMGQLLKARILAEKGNTEGATEVLGNLDQSKAEVATLNAEILAGTTFASDVPISPLWVLPWPNLENGLKKYFIDSSQRSFRFLWQVGEDTFTIPSSPAEILSNQEMLAFYQETPLNASSPLTHLHASLEAGEHLLGDQELPEVRDYSPDVPTVMANLHEAEETELTPLLAGMTVSKVAREYTLEDLALFFDSLDGSPLVQGALLERLEEAKELFIPDRFFESMERLRIFWEEKRERLTSSY